MNNKIRITRLIMTALIMSLAAILTALAPRNAEAAPPQPSTNFDAIDSYVGERLDDLRMPGAALGIVEDGEIVHIQTFGDADDGGTLVAVNTPFKIGSMSKSFTAMAVMQLVEARQDPARRTRTAIPSRLPGERSRSIKAHHRPPPAEPGQRNTDIGGNELHVPDRHGRRCVGA